MKPNRGDEVKRDESDFQDPLRWHLELALDHAENDTTTFHLRQALQLVEFDV